MGNSGSKISDPESWIQLLRLYGHFVFKTNANVYQEALLSLFSTNSNSKQDGVLATKKWKVQH